MKTQSLLKTCELVKKVGNELQRKGNPGKFCTFKKSFVSQWTECKWQSDSFRAKPIQ